MKKMNAMIASAMVVGGLMGGISTTAMAATHSAVHSKTHSNTPPKGIQKWVYGGHPITEITDFAYINGGETFIGTFLPINPDGILNTKGAGSVGLYQNVLPFTNAPDSTIKGSEVVESPLPLIWMWNHGEKSVIKHELKDAFFAPQLAAKLRKAHFPVQYLGMQPNTYPIAPPWLPVNAYQGVVNCPANRVAFDEILGYKVPLQGPWTPLYHPNNYSPYELWNWHFVPSRFQVKVKK